MQFDQDEASYITRLLVCERFRLEAIAAGASSEVRDALEVDCCELTLLVNERLPINYGTIELFTKLLIYRSNAIGTEQAWLDPSEDSYALGRLEQEMTSIIKLLHKLDVWHSAIAQGLHHRNTKKGMN